jgi:hypothetical protein
MSRNPSSSAVPNAAGQPAGVTTSTSTPSASGLEVLGIPGGTFLREALTSCSDPLQAIEEFQVENGILLPSLRPMMPLLDLHGVKRLDFHISVMEVVYMKSFKTHLVFNYLFAFRHFVISFWPKLLI